MVFMPLIFISILKLLLVYIPLFSEKGSEVVNPKKKKKQNQYFFKKTQTRKQEIKKWVK